MKKSEPFLHAFTAFKSELLFGARLSSFLLAGSNQKRYFEANLTGMDYGFPMRIDGAANISAGGGGATYYFATIF